MKNAAGFTLLEVLLSVTIMGMLIGLSVPVYETFVRRNDLDIAAQSLATMLRRAETYARGSQNDDAWSVEIQATTATLFQGISFGGRNMNYDETIDLPGTVSPSGLSELQFSKMTATPNTTGNIVLTSTTNDTRTITVNAKGMVSY